MYATFNALLLEARKSVKNYNGQDRTFYGLKLQQNSDTDFLNCTPEVFNVLADVPALSALEVDCSFGTKFTKDNQAYAYSLVNNVRVLS